MQFRRNSFPNVRPCLNSYILMSLYEYRLRISIQLGVIGLCWFCEHLNNIMLFIPSYNYEVKIIVYVGHTISNVSRGFDWAFTHWGRVTPIYVGSLTNTGSDTGLSPVRHQAIIWSIFWGKADPTKWCLFRHMAEKLLSGLLFQVYFSSWRSISTSC